MRSISKRFLTASLGGFVLCGLAHAQQTAPVTPTPSTPPAQQQGNQQGVDLSNKDIPGPIDSIQDLEDSGKILFKIADMNNDGQISQKEAVDAGNLMVGGVFFRADKNGDGTLSKEEAEAARDSLFRQQPLLRFVIQRSKAQTQQSNSEAVNTAKSAVQSLENMIDANRDNQLQAAELRQAVNMGVQTLYQMADTNHDTQLSPSEINASIVGVAKAAARTAFQTADTDNNSQISKQEFDKAIVEPASIVFSIFDANGDGQISAAELQTAEQIIANQLRNLKVPEPANSLGGMMRTGLTPEQSAPVPGVRTPKETDSQVRPAAANAVQPQ